MKKVFLLIVIGLCLSLSFSTAYAENRDPIVFVHGYSGSTATNFTAMIGSFQTDAGYPISYLKCYDYNSLRGVAYGASVLKSKVDSHLSATGRSKVDLVCHSMGGLVARYYMKNLGGAAKVDQVVYIATPHKGTDWAYLEWFTQAGRDMQPGSSLLNNLGSYCPGKSFWSSCDEIVLPNWRAKMGDIITHAGCWEHNLIMNSWGVYTGTRDYIAP